MVEYLPEQGILLARISDARNGDTRGVDDQVKRLRAHAATLGWTIGPDESHVIVENDTSAFQRYATCPECMQRVRGCTCPPLPDGRKRRSVLRTDRPGFRRALDMLDSGAADGLIALVLDRAFRDPRDLQDLIDVVKKRAPDVAVTSVTGDLKDLHTSAGQQMAEIMVSVAKKASQDTADRVARRREVKAANGEFGGGTRRFGYGVPVLDEHGRPKMEPITVDGKPKLDEAGNPVQRPVLDMTRVVEAEAAEVRSWAAQVLAGVSMRSIAADVRARGVPTVTGAEWNPVTIRDILARPGIAGLPVYAVKEKVKQLRKRGLPVPADVGVISKEPKWEQVLDVETWRAVAGKLTDPARRTSPGNTPRHLGSLIYRCGPCAEAGVEQTVAANGRLDGGPSYTCRGNASGGPGHLRRDVRHVDAFVEEVIVARLARPDAAALIRRPGQATDKDVLYAEMLTLRERKARVVRLTVDGTFTEEEARIESKPLNDRLTEIEGLLAATAERSPLDGLPLGTPTIHDVWPTLPLGVRRAVLRVLMDVTIVKGRPGRRPNGSYFDPDSVRITWKR